MKLWRSFAVRLVAIGIACGALVYISLAMVFRTNYRVVSEEASLAFTKRLVDRERTRCEGSPASWSLPFGADGELYVYDRVSHLSPNPNAPPFERQMLDLRGPRRTSLRYTQEGGIFQALVLDDGPCSLIQARWRKTDSWRQRFRFGEIVPAVIAIAFALSASTVLIIWPAFRRLARLDRAAQDVGKDGYASADSRARDEFGSLSRALDLAHDRIQAQTRELSLHRQSLEHFLSDIAHDLKTPLASLRLALEHLSTVHGTTDVGVNERPVLDGALRDAVYVADLAENLRLSHLLKTGWHPADAAEPVDLGDIVERVTRRAGVFAGHRGMLVAEAHPERAIHVRCSAMAAERAISNLVENAIHHGERGGHVSVVLESTGDRFSLFVRDDGPGLPPNELPTLLDPSIRGEQQRRSGSGLGLAIVGEVCGRCQWHLSFRLLEPRGLEVRIDGDCEAE